MQLTLGLYPGAAGTGPRGRGFGQNRQAADRVSCGASMVNPLASAPPGRLWASTGWVTGSKQKKSALSEGE